MSEYTRPEGLLNVDLNTALGIVVDDVLNDRARGHFNVEDRVRQPFGIVHGGAYAAAAETMASVGTFRNVFEDGKIAMGMSNDTTFLRSVTEGRIDVDAVAIHRGSTTWVWEVKMTDGAGRLCAVSRLTIAVRERRA
jgi:1,4-dihydroxy-2-naphthoyl-CoA hydrolase